MFDKFQQCFALEPKKPKYRCISCWMQIPHFDKLLLRNKIISDARVVLLDARGFILSSIRRMKHAIKELTIETALYFQVSFVLEVLKVF